MSQPTQLPHPDAVPGGGLPAQITPGLILMSLPDSRSAAIAHQLSRTIESFLTHHEPCTAARALLTMLTLAELRRVARAAQADESGEVPVLLERLMLLC